MCARTRACSGAGSPGKGLGTRHSVARAPPAARSDSQLEIGSTRVKVGGTHDTAPPHVCSFQVAAAFRKESPAGSSTASSFSDWLCERPAALATVTNFLLVSLEPAWKPKEPLRDRHKCCLAPSRQTKKGVGHRRARPPPGRAVAMQTGQRDHSSRKPAEYWGCHPPSQVVEGGTPGQ